MLPEPWHDELVAHEALTMVLTSEKLTEAPLHEMFEFSLLVHERTTVPAIARIKTMTLIFIGKFMARPQSEPDNTITYR
jgi:hypothetical protein